MNDQEKQQKMMQLQIMNQQGEQLKQQLMQFEEQMANLNMLQESLKVLEKTEVGNEMYTPLSSGVFVNAELKENKHVLISVGAGIVIKKKIEDAQRMLEDQGKKMELVVKQVRDEFEKFVNSARTIETELSESQ
jgi:prefoldin alpha subunit